MTLGYVTPATIKKAIILATELRQWNPKEVVKSFNSLFDKLFVYISLIPYRNEVRKINKSKMRKISEDNLKKGTEHINYEIQMFRETLILLTQSTNQITINTLLDSFTVHARNLFISYIRAKISAKMTFWSQII